MQIAARRWSSREVTGFELDEIKAGSQLLNAAVRWSRIARNTCCSCSFKFASIDFDSYKLRYL